MKNKEADIVKTSGGVKSLCLVRGSEKKSARGEMCFGVSGSNSTLNPNQPVPVTEGL